MRTPVRGAMVIAGALAALVACGPNPASQEARAPAAPQTAAAAEGSLAWAVQGPWRIGAERDRWRHPLETLQFFGIRNDMHVVEVYPGRGWYTAILAPYLARGGGRLTVATLDPMDGGEAQRQLIEAYQARFAEVDTFGEISYAPLSPDSGPLAEPNSVDLVLVFRNMHTFMAAGMAEKALGDFKAALKPGGHLGIVQHRAAPNGLQDPLATTGYVQEAYLRALVEEAGFEFVASSEVNANPKDTKDHPFGVWSLPPVLRTAPVGAPDNPDFDTRRFEEIGESDRMTLLFRKPE